MLARALTAPFALRCQCYQARYHGRSRKQQMTVCRYDLRKSANNAEERRLQRLQGTSSAEKALTPDQLQVAKASIVYQRAYQLCGGTKGQLSVQMCLFLFTEQPQLLDLSTDLLVARTKLLSQVLGLSLPDAAELLVRCGALIDVLPLRLHSTAESLSVALQLPKPQTLVMLASDINLLDTPPLRVKHQVDDLAAVLGVPGAAVASMVAGCPHILKVEGPAVQIRFASLQALLHLSTPQLLHLLQLEPRLLMPSSQHITQNHTEICLVFGVSAQTLNRWVAAAPMILLIAAQQLEKRVSALSEMLAIEAILMGVPEQGGTGANSAAINDDLDSTDSDDPPQEAQLRSLRFDRSDISSTAAVADLFSSRDDDADSQQPGQSSSISTSNEGWVSVARDAASMTDYISKDPRVLLLSPTEIKPRLRVVQQELMCSWECLVWLVMNHPSYLVVEPGSLTGWMFDVRHLCQMSSSQAIQLASCPQVFLAMSPEQVLLSLQAFSQVQQMPFVDALEICNKCPLLLEQHPAVTAAAVQQLSQLVPKQELLQQLMIAVPDMLLLGSRIQSHFSAAAALLALSSSEFGLMVKNQPSLWWVLVPRQKWHHHQHQQVPQWIEDRQTLVLQSLSALRECGLRPATIMQETAALQPALLTLGAAGVQRHLHILEVICSDCSYWLQQLRASLPPEQLGQVILRARALRLRLLFMVESDLSRRVGLLELMKMSSAEFTDCFGQDYQLWRVDRQQQRYREWQQWQQQQAGAWQHLPTLGWKQVGDQLQLHQQQSAPFLQQVLHGTWQQPALAAAAAQTAADSSPLRQQMFLSDATDIDPQHNAYRQQQQQQQWQSAETSDTGSSQQPVDQAEVYYALGDTSDLQWLQSSSGSSADDSDEQGSDDPYNGTLDDEDEQLVSDATATSHEDQQITEQQHIARNGTSGVVWQEPLLSRKEMQLLNVQQSGVELYGTWEGCLLRPLSSVVTASASGSSSAAAAAAMADDL